MTCLDASLCIEVSFDKALLKTSEVISKYSLDLKSLRWLFASVEKNPQLLM